MFIRVVFVLCLVLKLISTASVPINERFAITPERAIVQLFEWNWDDVALECERFLGPKGISGVQVMAPNEHVIIMEDVIQRPWFERYQPVSYKLETRSGNEDKFKSMVRRCNAAGVVVFADYVVNHMANGKGIGTAGNAYDSEMLIYEGVPYAAVDFHSASDCPSSTGNIENWNSSVEIRNCRLYGLPDLDQSDPYVRARVIEYINLLISYGVAGIRFDAAKYMNPSDLEVIIASLSDLPTEYGFPPSTRPALFFDIIEDDVIKASEYGHLGAVTIFGYANRVNGAFRKEHPLSSLKTLGEDLFTSNRALVWIDDHDTQRESNTGSGAITFREPRIYKMAVAFMLAWNYGYTRVMSSYYWPRDWQVDHDANNWIGPPHDGNFQVTSPVIDDNGMCTGDWICEHRWKVIYEMIKLRNVAKDSPVANWWDNGKDQIAFSRGNLAFIAINNEDTTMEAVDIQTGLPQGSYCDIITGSLVNGECTGKTIYVNADGTTNFVISATSNDPLVAIHIESKAT